VAVEKPDIFILFQMGSSDDWTWYAVLGVFLSEKALRDYAKKKSIDSDLGLREPGTGGNVILPEPVEFVAVRSHEGEVPEVELAEA
jgi:hypothetical protein